MIKCLVCDLTFASEKTILDHMEFSHEKEFCLACGSDLGAHVCVGKGVNGLEINFCLKAGVNTIQHMPHPRLCEGCKQKHESVWTEQIALDDEICDLEQKLFAKKQEREKLVKQIQANADSRIKLFCGHGLSKKHCPKCKDMWDKHDVEREKARLAAIEDETKTKTKIQVPTKRSQATFVVIPKRA